MSAGELPDPTAKPAEFIAWARGLGAVRVHVEGVCSVVFAPQPEIEIDETPEQRKKLDETLRYGSAEP